MRPPAQVDVLAVEAHRRVEPAEGAEQVGADQEAGRRDGEHVGDGVVLLLVDLADLDAAGRAAPKRSTSRPTSWRTRGLSHVTSFGPTMPALERYSSSTITRMASGSRATSSWQKQKNPLSPSTNWATVLAAGPKPGLPPSASTNASGRTAEDAPGDVVVGAVGDEEHGAQRRVVLAGERLEALVEPRAGGVDDDDGDDRRRGDRARSLSKFAVHGGLRLSVSDVLDPSRS